MGTKKITRLNQSRLFTTIVLILAGFGFFVFLSASLGLAGNDFSSFIKVGLKQFIILLIGLLVMLITSNIPYKIWRQYSLPLFILSVFVTLLVFVPQLGISAGGAKRWLALGGLSFQPSEILKIGVILYYGAWLAKIKHKVDTLKYGLMPLVIIISILGLTLLTQPDTDTFLVIVIALLAMFLVGGGRWKHLAIICLVGAILLAGLIAYKPYLKDRFITFLDPTQNTLGTSYQINQSLIAIGSGGITGRGFGQSLQKFSFLPEPNGDSIFSVAAEEFGFIGSIIILILFLLFSIIGLKIASSAKEPFGRLIVTGLVIMIISQSFINISSMMGLIPISGITLVFISQGGSSLLFSLLAIGIILNVSKGHNKSI
ncbi:MAG: putative peptidoglycan glycosyltransferase FtsW [Candidatus Paceibacterota bacterium]